MSIYLYQTFELKQDKFKEAIDNLRKIQAFRKEQYNQHVEILTPVAGKDHTYALLTIFEGLAEMELQDKKMFEDEEYLTLISDFFLMNTVQGSLETMIYRTISKETKQQPKEK
ncbi:MAG: hypothetical protein Q8934_09710 [Bacillota bacterium]|nr:hypothetical protein [Bacillota bacterium]